VLAAMCGRASRGRSPETTCALPYLRRSTRVPSML
jgi:hypothetical protein